MRRTLATLVLGLGTGFTGLSAQDTGTYERGIVKDTSGLVALTTDEIRQRQLSKEEGIRELRKLRVLSDNYEGWIFIQQNQWVSAGHNEGGNFVYNLPLLDSLMQTVDAEFYLSVPSLREEEFREASVNHLGEETTSYLHQDISLISSAPNHSELIFAVRGSSFTPSGEFRFHKIGRTGYWSIRVSPGFIEQFSSESADEIRSKINASLVSLHNYMVDEIRNITGTAARGNGNFMKRWDEYLENLNRQEEGLNFDFTFYNP